MVFGSVIFIILVYIKMCVSLNAGVMTTPIHFFLHLKAIFLTVTHSKCCIITVVIAVLLVLEVTLK